jgi:hypothetical protein
MEKFYKRATIRLKLLFILLLINIGSVVAQSTTIYKGDSILLSLNPFDDGAQIVWQRGTYSEGRTTPIAWTDILGATYNNYWIKPTQSEYYRAKVSKGSCYYVSYSEAKLVLMSLLPGVYITAEIPTNITYNSATISATVHKDGGPNIIARGVCWSATNYAPTIEDNKTENGSGTGPFTATITGLEQNTMYYVRGYITADNGFTYYGASEVYYAYSFKTPFLVAFELDKDIEVSYTTAVIQNQIKFNGPAVPIVSKGVVYRKNSEFKLDLRYPDLTDSFTTDGAGSDPFTSSLNGLASGVNYIYRVYAITADGQVYYSDIHGFATVQELEIVMLGITKLESESADIKYILHGKGTYLEYGFCYATSPSPTVSDTKIRLGLGPLTDRYIRSKGSLYPLSPNTRYYARPYLIDDSGAIVYGNEMTLTTLAANSAPLSITNYGATLENNGIRINSLIEGAGIVSSRGVCWRMNDGRPYVNPTIEDSKTIDGAGSGMFSSEIKGLKNDGTYYYRSYATLDNGTTIYSDENFVLYAKYIEAEVMLDKIVSVQYNRATISSYADLIQGTGSGKISGRGICYSTEPNPTVAGSKTSDGISSGIVETMITGLKAGTTYYARCYVIVNAFGQGYMTYYGDEFSFTTLFAPTELITTSEASSILNTSVVLGGTVVSNETIKERGVCWSTLSNPTTAGSKIAEGGGTGTFSIQINGLTPGTTYYAKAYAITTAGRTFYGEEVSFTMQFTPIGITTATITGITPSSAMSGGIIEVEDGTIITARGVCYSRTGVPTITDSKTSDGKGPGSFTSTLSGLTANATYYIRAYVTDKSNKTHYGDLLTFSTSAASAFQVTTTPFSNVVLMIPSYSGISGGTISGSATISAKGVCWNTIPNPTISNSKTTDGAGGAAYTSTLSGLVPGNIYYYRAYATNTSGVTVYGEQYSVYYETAITTAPVTNIQGTGATSGGTIPPAASGSIAARGVCWSTTQNPTIAASKTSDGAGEGNFISSLTGLVPNQVYYLRAYATLSNGVTYYGNEERFITTQTGTVSLVTLPATNITESSAEVSGTIVGSSQSWGICYGTMPGPTTTNNVVQVYTLNNDQFTAKLIGLTANTQYYARSFAALANGTVVYGNEIAFVASAASSFTVTTLPVANIQATWAQGGGAFLGTGQVMDHGVTFGTSPNPVAYSAGLGTIQMGSENNTTFTGQFGPFQPNIVYYARAFVRSKGGQVFYGNQVTFTSGTVTIETGSSTLNGMTVELGGYVVLYNGGTIADKGICWSTTNTIPTIDDAKISLGTSSGVYKTSLTGLTPSTTYYFRAYAITSNGTVLYGEVRGFITRDHPTIVVENRGTFEKTTTSMILGGNIENEGSEIVTSRGFCWDETNPIPTTAGKIITSGSGKGPFAVTLGGLSPGKSYYIRAYAITNAGKTVYSEVRLAFTNLYDIVNPPEPDPDPSDPNPPNEGGGSDGQGTFTPGVGDRFLVFGKVLGPATSNCREGSQTFSDYKGTGYIFVEGKYTRTAAVQAETNLSSQLKKRFTGSNYSYFTESSGEYSASYRYAVIIQYEKKIPGWDCTSVLVTIGYGNSYDSALAHALERKNKDVNGGNKAPYKILNKLHW